MSKKPTFRIEPVDKLPSRRFPERVKVYDEIISDIESRGKGVYKIEVSDRKSSSVYVALNKRIKNRKDLTIHFISGTVYLSKK